MRHIGADLEKAVGGLAEYYLRCHPEEDNEVVLDEVIDQPVSKILEVPQQPKRQETSVKPEVHTHRPLMAQGPWWAR